MIRNLAILLCSIIIISCSYEPIFTNKNYDFRLISINSKGETKINKVIKNILNERSKINSKRTYDIIFTSKNFKEIVSSNEKGDPTIFKIEIMVEYKIIKNSKIILLNEIRKQVTYNNINDKFELMKYEESIIKNLSEGVASEILTSIANLNR
tara:strand:- start:228 stop:686 length:459 start_codon:yes stop_codon:yes gene_type:complete